MANHVAPSFKTKLHVHREKKDKEFVPVIDHDVAEPVEDESGDEGSEGEGEESGEEDVDEMMEEVGMEEDEAVVDIVEIGAEVDTKRRKEDIKKSSEVMKNRRLHGEG